MFKDKSALFVAAALSLAPLASKADLPFINGPVDSDGDVYSCMKDGTESVITYQVTAQSITTYFNANGTATIHLPALGKVYGEDPIIVRDPDGHASLTVKKGNGRKLITDDVQGPLRNDATKVVTQSREACSKLGIQLLPR
jgi:hypothetical protein